MELEVRPRNGTTHPVDSGGTVRLHYENRSGKLYFGDSLVWLKGLDSGTVDLVFE